MSLRPIALSIRIAFLDPLRDLTSQAPIGIDQIGDLPAVVGLIELYGVDAAVMECIAQIEGIFHPGRGQALVYHNLDIPDTLVPDLVVRRADGVEKPIVGAGSVSLIGGPSHEGSFVKSGADHGAVAGAHAIEEFVDDSAHIVLRVLRYGGFRAEGEGHRGDEQGREKKWSGTHERVPRLGE